MINDDEILKKIKMKIAVSKFEEEIKDVKYTKKNIWSEYAIKRIFTSVIGIVFMGSGIVFAHNIYNKYYGNNVGLNKAIKSGYVQNIDMEYNYQNNVGVKVDRILIDDSNIDLVFSYKGIKNKEIIGIDNLKIIDENNNVIFEDGNIKSLTKEFGVKNEKVDNLIIQEYEFKNTEHNFPKSKVINITFSGIKLKENNENIKGDWKFSINVQNNMVDRFNVRYIADKNDLVEVKKAILTNTGLDIEFKLNTKDNLEDIISKMKIIDETGKEHFTNGILSEEGNILRTSFTITPTDNGINKLILNVNGIDIKLNREE